VRPAVLHQTWPAIAFWATVGVTLGYDLMLSATRHVDAGAAKDRAQLPLHLAVGLGVTVAIWLAPRVHELDTPGGARWPVIAGFAIAWAGFAFRIWSIRTLGRYFTKTLTTVTDQPVIDTGPYRIVRHPSYTGLIATMFGIGVMLGNWLSLALCFGTTLIAFAFRILTEERMLRRELGEPYERYAATHKRLVPGVW
jgi:protein-S-isoprenylcysteine O-methyltransferase Ste14